MDGRYAAGGSAVLAELIDEYGGALISDFLHYYRIDLRDLFRNEGDMSPRWVLNLITGLPMELEYHSQKRGGKKFRNWGPSTYALADIATSMRSIVYLYLCAHIDPKKSKKPAEPQPFWIPDAPTRNPKKTGVFAKIVGSMIADQRRRKKVP